jgi:hypothetical protein
MTTVSKLDAALTYASWGWRVLPVIPNDKRPATAHGVNDATSDQEQIRDWWTKNPDYNIGIAAGEASGIVVFDIDPRNGGDDSWDAFIKEHGDTPDGAYQLTAGGGQHYIANWQDGIKSCELRPGVDLLANGRYFLASPSSINGKSYEWEASSDPFDGVAPFTIPEAWRAAMAVRKVISNASESGLITGNRNAGLTAIAGSMRHYGLSEHEIHAALMVANATRCEIPLPASEVAQIAHSVARYAPESDVAADMALGAQGMQSLLQAPKTMDVDYLPDRLKATEYVIDGFIGMGLTILAGEPGGGKTSIIVPLIAHAAHLCDKNSFLKPELRRHIVYVSEDIEQVERCIYAMKKYSKFDIDAAEYKQWFHIREAHRSKPEHIASLLKDIDEDFTYRLPNGFKVKPIVIFDTSNATIEIENENDNSEVGKVIAKIKQSSNGLAVIVVAHTAKALQRTDLSSLTPRGASAWIGDARATIYLFSDESVPEARFLALGKRRFEPTYTEIRFDSETYTEVVATPWGSSQSVGLRVVTAEASSQEERKQAAKLGKQAANSMRLREQELVVINQLQSLPRDQYRTMNELIEQLTGAKSARLDIVHGLINKKEIELFNLEDNESVPKRVKQHKDGLRISPTYEQESNG